jgi:hypothetical protein
MRLTGDPDAPFEQNGHHLTFAQAQALGWPIAVREPKHLYVTNVGRDRRKWRRELASLPYPVPQPELKLQGGPPS